MRILIKNAAVVLPDAVANVGVIIEGDQIAEIDPASQVRVDLEVDAAGFYLLPGVVDDQPTQ